MKKIFLLCLLGSCFYNHLFSQRTSIVNSAADASDANFISNISRYFFSLFLFLVLACSPVVAQTFCNSCKCSNKTTADGLGSNEVLGVYESGGILYVATRGGLSTSTNGGDSFTNKTTADGLGENNVYGVYESGGVIYAATRGGLSISTNGGATYSNKNTVDGLGHDFARGVYESGGILYAATRGGLSISTNGGTTFSNSTTTNGLGSNNVRGVYESGGVIYVATDNGLTIFTNGGTTFSNKTTTNGLGSNDVSSVYESGGVIYAATTGGLSISTNGGTSFTNKTTANGLGSNIVNGVYESGGVIYVATNGGLSTSTDGGASFTNKTTVDGLGANIVNGVFESDGVIYVATDGGLSICGNFIIPSELSCTNKTIADGLGHNIVYGVYELGGVVYAATRSGLSISTDGGGSFTNKTTADGLGANIVNGVYESGGAIYAATDGGLSISTDGGGSFTNKTTTDGLGHNMVYGMYKSGGILYVATDDGLSISTDGGGSFTNKTTVDGLGNNYVLGVYESDGIIYAATFEGLAISTDGGGSFTNKTTVDGLGGNYVSGVYESGGILYAATNDGLSISTDGGGNFTNKTTVDGLGDNVLFGVYESGRNLYVATDGGLSISTDGGGSFTNKTTTDGLGSNIVYGVYESGGILYTATAGGLSICGITQPNITASNTSICIGQSIDLSTLIIGSPSNILEYGTTYGTYGLNKVQSPTTKTTFYVRDSNTTTLCVDTTKMIITVVPQPAITGRNRTICKGESVDLSTLIEGMPLNTLAYGTVYGSYGSSKDQTPMTTTTFYVRDLNTTTMCVDTAKIVITVNAQPAITGLYRTICKGESVDLSTLIDGVPLNTLAYGTVYGTYGSSKDQTPMTTTTYYVRDLSTTTMCEDTAKIVITVNAQPAITGRNKTICKGESVDLSTLIDGVPLNTLAYGTVYGTYGSSKDQTPMTTTTYYVRDLNTTTMCEDTAKIVITVNAQPAITGLVRAICKGESVDLSTLIDGVPLNTLAYGAVYGTYGLSKDQTPMTTTTFYVRDLNTTTLCEDTAKIVVMVENQPNISARDTAICRGQSISLSSLINETATNNFEYGATYGTYSVAILNTQTPLIDTTFFVRDSVQNAVGCVDTTQINIVVENQPVITARDTAICRGQSITLSHLINETATNAYEYGVTYGTYSAAILATQTPLTDTTFFVRDSVQNNLGCVDTTLINIVVENQPAITARDTAICRGQSITLNHLINEIATNSFEYGATYGTYSAAILGTQTPLTDTIFFVRDSVQNTVGCADTSQINIVVENQPAITARDTAICKGQFINLSSLINETATNGFEYGATFGTYSAAILNNQTPLTDTIFFVRDSVQNAVGCADTSQINIVVENQPFITARDTSVMLGEPVDLSTLLNQNSIGNLDFGTIFGTYGIANPVTATATMPFYIRDSIQNEVGCVDTTKVLITIPTVNLSMADEDGDGHPDILDPCSCFDPQNVVESLSGNNTNVKLFHDFVVITNGGIGQTWQLNKINTGAVLQKDGTPFPIGETLNDLGGGVYRIDFWHRPDEGFNADFRRLSDNNIQTTGGSCDGQACLIIPTMSEWGLLIFGLLILNLGLMLVLRRERV